MILMRRLRLFMLFESYRIITVQKHRQKTYGLFRKLTKEMRGVFCQAYPTISRSQRQTPQWKPHVMLVYKLLELFKLNGPRWYVPKPTEFNAQIFVQLVLYSENTAQNRTSNYICIFRKKYNACRSKRLI